ncbi:MAG: homoserine kinase [Bacillota bacterium]
MLKMKIPATSANIGPGFDCLGVALNIFLELTIQKSTSNQFIWKDKSNIVKKENNLIINTIDNILKKNNSKKNYKITVIKNDIPISRGLGSSAAAIVAGVYCANYLLDNKYSNNELIKIASDIEGHPDNIVPSIKGGLQISKKINNKYIIDQINFPKNLNFCILVPNFKLSTKKAREALPKKYKKKDVLFTLSNLGMLINAFNNNNLENIKYLLEDKIHQPYRINLIKDGKKLFKKIDSLNTYGKFISGAGPTLICLIKDEKVLNEIDKYINTLNTKWKIYKSTINNQGIKLEVNHG